ncbi:type II toxin-antitoxin system HipA family toxin [Thalassospira lucentensis]|uniref:type II toxin-antitoxin system HipA family toxin n=1 Tax=Thalassospira lucentensis TaxID=168935 RepID=UPI003D288AD2|tara:strand:- start:939 stop:2171 length:1233 start_codon:yes stop_codon:yes gene_type:complete
MNVSKKVNVYESRGHLQIGELTITDEGHRRYSVFDYADEWVASENAFPICPEMELRGGPFFRSSNLPRDSIHQVFQDATPDSWGRKLLERAFSCKFSEHDFLLNAPSETCIGSLSFFENQEHHETKFRGPVIPDLSDLDRLSKLIDRYLAEDSLKPVELTDLVNATATLGGARPKVNVLDNGTLWIAKFTSPNDKLPIERMEIATLKLARLCGIDTPDARLLENHGRSPIALIKRFDRRDQNRVPYISARTALGKEGRAQGNYIEIAEFIRASCEDASHDLHQLFLRMVFSILVTNKDNHLKNHGFLHYGGNKWHLAPAFDINPVPELHARLETPVSSIATNNPLIIDALDNCSYFELTESKASALIKRTAHIIHAQWLEIANQVGITSSDARKYKPAIDTIEMSTALTM